MTYPLSLAERCRSLARQVNLSAAASGTAILFRCDRARRRLIASKCV